MNSVRRIRALVRKEILQISRDPSSILIAFILPLILLFIFGYGVSLDSKHVRLGLVIEQPSAATESFASAFDGSEYFDVTRASHLSTLEEALVAGELRGIVVLPANFAERLGQSEGNAPIQVITDGSEPQIASFVENYVRGVWLRWRELQALEHESSIRSPVSVEARFWFNPALTSRNFLLPGSIAIIMTVIGALLTALVIAREWERGTMEALLSSPLSRAEMLLGKVIPYYLLGLLSFFVCVAIAVFLFQIPLRGSLFALFACIAAFLPGALGIGLTISAVTKNQFVASQIALNAAFLPAFLLSGFIFEIHSMPLWIQQLTRIIPARYFVSSLQTVFLAGDDWSLLLPKLGVLMLMGVLFLGLTARNLKRSLD